jgi:N-acetylneuraminic acid mutarotase
MLQPRFWLCLLVTAGVAGILPALASAAAWTPIASLPRPTADGVGVAVGGRAYVIGGYQLPGDVLLADVEAYDPVANTWTAEASLPTARWAGGGALGHDGRVYIIGGNNPSDPTTIGEVYDPISNAWSALPPMPGTQSQAAAALGGDGRIYLVGGSVGPGSIGVATVTVYDPTTSTWDSAPPMGEGRRNPAVTTGLDGRIYVFGGDADCCDDLSSAERFDPSTQSWEPIASMPTPRQGAQAVTALDGRIYVIGGLNFTGALTTVEIYDPVSNTWATGPSLAGDGRLQPMAAVVGTRIVVAGGFTGDPFVSVATAESLDLGQTAPRQPMVVHGAGTETPPTSCHRGICDVGLAGRMSGTPIRRGTYAGVAHVDFAAAFDNGQGGFCWPSRGALTLVSRSGAKAVVESVRGTACEVGTDRPNAPITFIGRYTVSGGTGPYARASGGRHVSLAADGLGADSLDESGHVSLNGP